MRSFNYSFLESGMFSAKLVNKLYSVAELHGRINLRKDSMCDVLTRIEPRAITDSISDNEHQPTLYRKLRAKINKNYNRIDISVDNILEFHNILLPNSRYNNNGYRYNSHSVKMPGEIEQNVKFPTIPPGEAPEAMHQLVNAYNETVKNVNINPLFLIPCFVFDFLCIRPFEHGNKQMSQLLFLLLLCKSGFEVIKYIPFERQIYLSKAECDISFKDSTVDWHEGKNEYFPYIEYFLDVLLFSYKELDKYRGAAVVKPIKITKTKRIKDTVLSSSNPISKAEIHAELSYDVGMSTIEKVLREMLREDVVEMCGGGRSTKYIRKEQ